MSCDDKNGDCLHCLEKAPGNCILMDQHLMEYYCTKHRFSPTRPAMIEIVRGKLDRDPGARQKLREALERVSMGGDGYVSMVDSISLANWLIQIFDIRQDAFEDVYIKDLKKLGVEILCSH